MKSLFFAVLLSAHFASAMEIPDVIRVDGRDNTGEVTVSDDGLVTVCSTGLISTVELRWRQGVSCAARVLGGEWERTYGRSGWSKLDPDRALPWYFLAADGVRVESWGVAVQPAAFAAWYASTNGVRLRLDVRAGSRPVRLGGRMLEACRILHRVSPVGETPFAAGRAFCRLMCPNPRLPREPVYGYNDWYCAYGKNTATNFLADVAFLASLLEGVKNRPFAVADDGWQNAVYRGGTGSSDGDWTTNNPVWGMAMDEFARRVRALGARPGLWYRPYFPGDKKGLPIDPTDPCHGRRIRSDIARFRSWGMELVKADFITFDWSHHWNTKPAPSPLVRDDAVWQDDTRTTAEVVRDHYRTIREAAGDLYVIGCNAIDHFAGGLFEIQRTGDDTSGRYWWPTRKNGVNTLGLRILHHGTFYATDADCAGLVEDGMVPWDLNAQWIDLVARSGTPLFLSWKRRDAVRPEVREGLRRALRLAAVARPVGEPLDWMENPHPRKWRFADGEAAYDWEPKSSLAVEIPGRGTVFLDVGERGKWTYELRRVDGDGLSDVVTLALSARHPQPGNPPPAELTFSFDQDDIDHLFSPVELKRAVPWVKEMGRMSFGANRQSPVFSWVSATDENRFTFACSDVRHPMDVCTWESTMGGSRLHVAATCFGGACKPYDFRTVLIRLDFRKVPFAQSVSEACDWMAEAGEVPASVPPARVYEPLWNTWYGYQIGYTADDVARESRIAAELGMGGVVLDMGWDRRGDTNSTSFAECGDWNPEPHDFPDFPGLVDRLHGMGLSCLVWCGVPLVGEKAAAFEDFRGKLLTDRPTDGGGKCHSLDPRFPEVRRHLVRTIERGLRDWGIDGWKIDFLQNFRTRETDRAETGLAGRDCRWVADATMTLQDEMAAAASRVKPKALFEYMYPYAGIPGQGLATQVRCPDCPGDVFFNRCRTAELRLLAGNRAAVHSDMLTWSPSAIPETCARQIVAVLHAVVQYGMRLTSLTPDQRRVVAQWVRFQRMHAETLFHGTFRPHGSAAGYPVIEMESAVERIVTVCAANSLVSVAADRSTVLVNGTGTSRMPVRAERPAKARLYDVFGDPCGEVPVPQGCAELPVPDGGHVVIELE